MRETSDTGLMPRERAVLRAIVERYVESAEPVSSGSLSAGPLRGDDGKHESVSSATIRNTMATLEAKGLIHSPHTSAGRVPTAAGIAVYTRSLLRTQPLSRSEKTHAESLIVAQTGSASVLSSASRGLSRLVTQLALCLAPSAVATVFDHIEFVRIGQERLVAIFVARTGAVYNRIIDLEREVPAGALERINAIMREHFCGLNLTAIRARLGSELTAERARCDELYRRALELGAKGAPDGSVAEVYIDGAAHCIAHKEIAVDAERLQLLLRTVEEKTLLLHWLERVPADIPRVTLGEGDLLRDLALVTAPYATPSGERGVLGILGPLCMNYAHIMPRVVFSALTVTRQLLGSTADGREADEQ